jgi:predicted transcriptional regulator
MGLKKSTRGAQVMSLRTLRQSLGKTQGEVARTASMTQPQLSRVEARRDHRLSTLRKYVRAMGGDVDVIARIDGREFILRDV